jgi:arabinan endo-1,5-alpha-L-arabinosidase
MRRIFSLFILFLFPVYVLLASGKDEPIMVPVMGQSVHIFDQGAGEKKPWYINDHCIVKGPDNRWHLFGITHQVEVVPLPDFERFFAHASSPTLLQIPWQKHPLALKYDHELGETHVWAPHIIEKDGTYYMFYAAGGGHWDSMIDLATSKDLFHWERPPVNPLFKDFYDARDPMVLKHGDEYLLYYCKTFSKEDPKSTVALRRSKDLVHWSEPEFALVLSDFPRVLNSGHTESPFVFERQGRFYMVVCTPYLHYRLTRVFVSDNPFKFDEKNEITAFVAHCAEIVEDNGNFYASHAGWFYQGVYLAPLSWRPSKKFEPQFVFLNSGESTDHLVSQSKTKVGYSELTGRFSTNKVIDIQKGGKVVYKVPVPAGVKLVQLFICGAGGYQIAVAGTKMQTAKDPSSSEGLDLYWLDDEKSWSGGTLELEVSSPNGEYQLNFLRLYFLDSD